MGVNDIQHWQIRISKAGEDFSAMYEYGILTSKDRYTKFTFMNYTITFMTSKDLVRYVKVTSIDDGVLTVSCIGKVKKEYEDYIDLTYILTNLKMNPDEYLKGLKGVEIKYA